MPDLSLKPTHRRKRSEDARQFAYRIIKTCILELIFLPGQKMSEIDVAASLDISRTPVHDTFTRLSRENMVDIIPQRGAFVSKIDSRRIEQALWLHSKLGASMLNTIYLKNLPRKDFQALYEIIHQMEEYLDYEDYSHSSRLIHEFYHQLYVLAGDTELIWSSLHRVDTDLGRLLSLITTNPAVARGIVSDLTRLADALVERNYEIACSVYTKHLDRLGQFAPPIQELHPQYFLQAENAVSSVS